MTKTKTQKFFTTVCEGPDFFIFTTPNGEFFIAKGKHGEEPRLDDAQPILIRSADREYGTDVQPRTLDRDIMNYMMPIDGLSVSEVFQADIAKLPKLARAFLLDWFGQDLVDAENFFRFPETNKE